MNRKNREAVGVWLAAVLCGVAACSVLSPQQDRSQFFVLTAVADDIRAGASAAGVGREISIGLGPVRLPDYLKQPEMVTRVGKGQLELSENRRWAEPLDASFQRVLGQDLARHLGTRRMVMFPWYGTAQIDYQVEIQVSHFEINSDRHSQLTATWIIKSGKTGAVLLARETATSTAAAADDASGSMALSRDVNVLSERIAEGISELNRKALHAAKARDRLRRLADHSAPIRNVAPRSKESGQSGNCSPKGFERQVCSEDSV